MSATTLWVRCSMTVAITRIANINVLGTLTFHQHSFWCGRRRRRSQKIKTLFYISLCVERGCKYTHSIQIQRVRAVGKSGETRVLNGKLSICTRPPLSVAGKVWERRERLLLRTCEMSRRPTSLWWERRTDKKCKHSPTSTSLALFNRRVCEIN